MNADFVQTPDVQALLDRASGLDQPGGDPRIKAITRDLCEALMVVLAKYDVTESEFWKALAFLQTGSAEYGLIVAGLGIEHYVDLLLEARDAELGLQGGTPRTIEGPLYVAGAPLVEGHANLTDDADDTDTLTMHGEVRNIDGNPVPGVILHVWHANSQGWYSHFDPTGPQTPFNNRRRIKLGDDGRYSFESKMPRGYSVPPGGATDRWMQAMGRHGDRPAHVHFFVEAPGYRTLTTQINFGDDLHARDDFAFGTRDGLLPVPERSDGAAHIAFDFVLQKAVTPADESLSERPRANA